MNSLQCIDYSFLRAPYEELNSKFHTTKRMLEKEISFAASHLKLMKKYSENLDRQQAKATIQGLINRLKVLRSSLEKCYEEEDNLIDIIDTRTKHLTAKENNSISRFYRLVEDHYARQGDLNFVTKLSEKTHTNQLVDIEIFQKGRKIIADLQACDVNSALDWCDAHKSKLRKLKSSLEFELKLQKFIEMIRDRNMMGAINYARSHFGQYPENQSRIQHAMMLLAVVHRKDDFSEYCKLLDDSRWKELISLFWKEMLKVYNMTTESPFAIALRAGLAALKTPLCAKVECRSEECPMCQPNFQALITDIPHAHHSHSSLLCRLMGTVMSENNLPVVLPNGQAFSEQGIKKIIKDGKVICPISGKQFSGQQISKIYVV